jgi:hypothetical protein
MAPRDGRITTFAAYRGRRPQGFRRNPCGTSPSSR